MLFFHEERHVRDTIEKVFVAIYESTQIELIQQRAAFDVMHHKEQNLLQGSNILFRSGAPRYDGRVAKLR